MPFAFSLPSSSHPPRRTIFSHRPQRLASSLPPRRTILSPRLQRLAFSLAPRRIIWMVCLLLLGLTASAQVDITGTVFDKSQLFTMPGVSVLSNSGYGTQTDSVGHYRIRLPLDDSIYFSYLGRHTAKIAVRRIAPGYPLNMSLAVTVDSLPIVVVKPQPYRYDSLANRDEYRKIFDYSAEGVIGGASGGPGVGLNLDMIFSARKNRQMLALQRRLVEEEHDKYVDYRFNRTLVRRITGLQRPLLDTFMRIYRPSYEYIRSFENDYDYYKFIKDCSLSFRAMWRRNLPTDHPHPLEN